MVAGKVIHWDMRSRKRDWTRGRGGAKVANRKRMELIMLETIWGWFVFGFVGGVIIPAVTHPIETCVVLVGLNGLVIWSEW